MATKKYGPGEIGAMLKARTFCDDHGHKFEVVAGAVTRKNNKEGTEIWNSFICTQCGEMIDRRVALWPHKEKPAGSKEPF